MMPDSEKQIVYDAIREYLWVAKTWNEHNFKPEVIREKAQKLALSLGIRTVEQANAFLDLLQEQLDK